LPGFLKGFISKLLYKSKAGEVRFKARKMVEDKADELVQKNKTAQNSQQDNFISTLINCQDKETGKPLLDKEIRDSSITFLIAGHETTKMTLSQFVYVTTQYPHVLTKMLEEIDRFFPNFTTPTDFEDLKTLEYTSMVINEVLRVYPPVPHFTRENDTELEIGGYRLPAHSRVFMPIYAIHMDPETWGEDVELFKPERWTKPPKDQLSFVPFGAGNRNCVGMRFALIEAKILIVRVFQRFRFELVAGKNKIPPVIEEGLITSRLKDPLLVNVLKR